MKASPASRIQSNLQEFFQSGISSGTAYVRIKLTQEIDALLPMSRIEESHIVAVDQVTPLPAMPQCVIGMMNFRDHVFCVFDLAQLLSLANPILAPQNYQILVINTSELNGGNDKKVLAGLVVNQIQGIVRVLDNEIHKSTDVQEGLGSFMTGHIQEEKRKTIILDPTAIVSRLSALHDQRIF